MTQPATAQDIYQDLIDTLDAHICAGAFDQFAALIVLPHIIQTHDDRLTVNTRAQLRASFDDMRHRLAMRNVARRARYCTTARFEEEGLIKGTHTTWLIAERGTILESYKVSNTLRLDKGHWRIAGNEYAGPPDTLPAHMADAMANATVGRD